MKLLALGTIVTSVANPAVQTSQNIKNNLPTKDDFNPLGYDKSLDGAFKLSKVYNPNISLKEVKKVYMKNTKKFNELISSFNQQLAYRGQVFDWVKSNALSLISIGVSVGFGIHGILS